MGVLMQIDRLKCTAISFGW